MKKKPKKVIDVLPNPRADRRLLSHVPDPTGQRQVLDRRDNGLEDDLRPQSAEYAGQRFLTRMPVRVTLSDGSQFWTESVDISQTGIMLVPRAGQSLPALKPGEPCRLRFHLLPGVLPEGVEKRYHILADIVRVSNGSLAVHFHEPLYQNRKRTVDGMLLASASFFMFIVVLVILLMRAKNVVYFRQNSLLYGYSMVAAGFLLTRYLFGALYKPFPVNPDYTPSVTVVIPCFNEETWIGRTIISCIDQDYPPDKLEIIIVDDGSTDDSVNSIYKTVKELGKVGERFHTSERIRVFIQKRNQGKREGMALGIRNCRTEMIAFVDSDSFLEPNAIRCLVQPLYDKRYGGVTGRTDVVNTYTNHLTKMQSVRYYISFRMIKAAEAYFDSVMCLSGPLSCYRLSVVNEVFEKWLHQTFMGQKATFGDDRSLTNFVVRNHRTYYQDTAICSTLVPNRHKQFLKQQMRWKRSWLRESLKAGSFMWRKEPLMALSFYIGLLIPMVAPLIVVYNVVYVPLVYHVFPTTFLLGILLMSLMMSLAQLLLKRSTLWVYGMLFCVYYEAILLWQMPWAWVTFWVSNWGTRGGTKKKKGAAAPSAESSAAPSATPSATPSAAINTHARQA